jgi:hypothetical protein
MATLATSNASRLQIGDFTEIFSLAVDAVPRGCRLVTCGLFGWQSLRGIKLG